jgi:uncharacterized FlaG/YvyC family protein
MVNSVQGVGSIVIQSATESINVNLRKFDGADNAPSKEAAASRIDESTKSATDSGKAQGRDTIELSKLADKLHDLFGKDKEMKVEFSKDKDSDKMIFKLIDNKTSEVLKQIPPEIVLKISKYITNTLEGGEITNAKV